MKLFTYFPLRTCNQHFTGKNSPSGDQSRDQSIARGPGGSLANQSTKPELKTHDQGPNSDSAPLGNLKIVLQWIPMR